MLLLSTRYTASNINLNSEIDSTSTQQETINEANQVLDNLVYRNERSMTFEKFSSKLQNALNDLADCGRPVHDGDIVDKLWGRIQNSDLVTYVAALKIEYTRNQRDYKEILQDIATQIPSLPKHVSFGPKSRNSARAKDILGKGRAQISV